MQTNAYPAPPTIFMIPLLPAPFAAILVVLPLFDLGLFVFRTETVVPTVITQPQLTPKSVSKSATRVARVVTRTRTTAHPVLEI